MLIKTIRVMLGLFLVVALQVSAQPYQISVSQFVEHPALDAILKGFQDSLASQKIETNYKVHNAQANMGTASQIASQIIGENPNLILAIATPSAQTAAQALTKAPSDFKAPLLFSGVTDPVDAGLVKRLASPEGRITGVSDMTPMNLHVAMIKKFFPDLKKLGVMYNSGEANSKANVESLKAECAKIGVSVVEATASKTSDVYQAAKSLVGRVEAVYVPTDNTIVAGLEAALKVGIQSKMPIFAGDVDSVERGAVAAMGFDYYQHGVQTGLMAGKILKGQSVSASPVEFQKKLVFHINQSSADKMGVTVAESLISSADKVYP